VVRAVPNQTFVLRRQAEGHCVGCSGGKIAKHRSSLTTAALQASDPLEELVFIENDEAVFSQQGSGYPVAGPTAAAERPIVNIAGTAGGAAVFQDDPLDLVEKGQIECFTGAPEKSPGYIVTVAVKNKGLPGKHIFAFSAPELCRRAGRGQSSQLFRADRDQFLEVYGGDAGRVLAFTVIGRSQSQQASANQVHLAGLLGMEMAAESFLRFTALFLFYLLYIF